MRKRLNILLCFVLVVILTACSAGKPQTSDSDGKDSSAVPTASEGSDVKTNTPSGDSTGEKTDIPSGDSTGEQVETGLQTPDEGAREAAEIANRYSEILTDELKWEYNSASKTIVISGEGPMRSYMSEVPAWDVYAGEAERVVIGDKITSVGDMAFWAFSALTEIKLGDDIEYIGDSAFADCYSLRTMNFPKNLKYVGLNAFVNALLHSDNGFVFPDGVEYIESNAFFSAFKESYVSLPASVKYIGAYAFANCFVQEYRVDEGNKAYASVDGALYSKDMTTLLYYPPLKTDKIYEVPDTVQTIKRDAIEVSNYLEKIVVPKSVSLIEEGAIYWNYALTAIDVATENETYKSEDGVLYTKDGRKLIAYPLAADRIEYTVSEGTEEICEYAFSNAEKLEKVHVKDGLKRIGNSAFMNCSNMVSIGLPAGLESIEENAFCWCDGLTRVNYFAGKDEWAKITIGEGNDVLSSEIVYPDCTEQ